jgi:branched-chain amino acid transport system ATP-binding protein
VLQGVDLTVYQGSITAVIGPNGAGKSTLLKTIMGFLTLDRGAVFLRGESLVRWRVEDRVRRGVAYVSQDRCSFGPLTVAENLRVGAFLERDRSVVRRRMQAVYERFPALRMRQHQPAGLLSGGELRTLEIGRFLMMKPELVLLDEPSIGLAPLLVDQVYREVEQLRREGLTFLIVEQNVRKILQVADLVYVLELGRNRFAGAPSEITADDKLARLYLGAGIKPPAASSPR